MSTNVHFSDSLKAIRKQKKLSQAEFSEFLDIPINTYKSYELQRREPSFSAVTHICRKLGISVGVFTGEDSYSLEKQENTNFTQDLPSIFHTLARHSDLIEAISKLPNNEHSDDLIQDITGMIKHELKSYNQEIDKKSSSY